MNLASLLFRAGVGLFSVVSVWALSNPVQLTPDVVANTACRITVTPVAEGLNFSFSFREGPQTNVTYSSYLKLYNGKELVAVCPIEKFRDGPLLLCDFTVAENYLNGSRFIFTVDAPGATALSQYWFNLRDFARKQERR